MPKEILKYSTVQYSRVFWCTFISSYTYVVCVVTPQVQKGTKSHKLFVVSPMSYITWQTATVTWLMTSWLLYSGISLSLLTAYVRNVIYCLLIFCTAASRQGCQGGVGDQFWGAGPHKRLFVAPPPRLDDAGARPGTGKKDVDKVFLYTSATVHSCKVLAVGPTNNLT